MPGRIKARPKSSLSPSEECAPPQLDRVEIERSHGASGFIVEGRLHEDSQRFVVEIVRSRVLNQHIHPVRLFVDKSQRLTGARQHERP
jgi:hypothetical protein